MYCYISCNITWKRNINMLVFGVVFLKKLNLVSLNIFIYLHTPTWLSDLFCMKQLKLTLHTLKLFYYSRKRWPCRLKDVLITANVYSTTGNCTDSVLRNHLATFPPVWSCKIYTRWTALCAKEKKICLNTKVLEAPTQSLLSRSGKSKAEVGTTL